MGVGLKRNWGFAATLCAFLLAFAMSAPAAGATDIDSLPMHFSIVASGKDCPGCVIINASGEIVDDTSRDFCGLPLPKTARWRAAPGIEHRRNSLGRDTQGNHRRSNRWAARCSLP